MELAYPQPVADRELAYLILQHDTKALYAFRFRKWNLDNIVKTGLEIGEYEYVMKLIPLFHEPLQSHFMGWSPMIFLRAAVKSSLINCVKTVWGDKMLNWARKTPDEYGHAEYVAELAHFIRDYVIGERLDVEATEFFLREEPALLTHIPDIIRTLCHNKQKDFHAQKMGVYWVDVRDWLAEIYSNYQKANDINPTTPLISPSCIEKYAPYSPQYFIGRHSFYHQNVLAEIRAKGIAKGIASSASSPASEASRPILDLGPIRYGPLPVYAMNKRQKEEVAQGYSAPKGYYRLRKNV